MRNIVCNIMLVFLTGTALWAQQSKNVLRGKVTEQNPAGGTLPLVGANVYWSNTTLGTITDENGDFELQKTPQENVLVVSYIGYQNDTIPIDDQTSVSIQLQASVNLDAVDVVVRTKSTEISMLKTVKVEQIGEKELLKAACCNLSESFETNPSVDVSFTDAVTGTKQIQMLGLAGPYTQISRENMPSVRGLSAVYGLTFIPGTWIEGIQLNKGTGSVLNGFESIAGQINVELRKPENAESLYLNLYGNEGGRMEANANFAHKFNAKWSTAVLLHAKNNSIEWDKNKDGFMDQPIGNNYIGINRWKYFGENGLRMQLGIKGTYIDKTGGQLSVRPEAEPASYEPWNMNMTLKRLEGWAKIGKVYEDIPWKTMGLQVSASAHQQDSKFGLNQYDAQQSSLYANYIYQGILSNTNHVFKTGASLQYDNFTEDLNTVNYKREEIVPGVYFEYTYKHFEKFSMVAGLRADYHNLFGAFVTPRLHVRYAITSNTVLRASAGRGQRTASILSENNSLLASSRNIIIKGDDSNKPYGLQPEVAWNYGANLTQKFDLAQREVAVSFDFYRTYFTNQIVLDLEQSPQEAVFYNLDGKSFSNSFQSQIDYELITGLDVRLAYRWFDVKTSYQDGLKRKPLIAPHRAFINLGYATKSKWSFDYTLNWQGEKYIPDTDSNPLKYRLSHTSPAFVLMNAQVSKKWGQRFEIYLGVENLLNYKQKNPIISSAQPYSKYFDSTLIWGPIFGRKLYAGIRYRIL